MLFLNRRNHMLNKLWGSTSALVLGIVLGAQLAAAQAYTHPVVQAVAAERPAVSDALLARLKKVHIENAWSVLMKHGYEHQFAAGFIASQPDVPLVGRAVTLQYLPIRPDLEKAVKAIAQKTDHSPIYNVRAAEEAKPGDVIVVQLGGLAMNLKDTLFMGDVTATGIRARGAAGVIIDGGTRDPFTSAAFTWSANPPRSAWIGTSPFASTRSPSCPATSFSEPPRASS
jgi:hypothetical protein